MKRREFFAFFVGVVSWPFTARAQTQSGAGQVPGQVAGQVADDALGQIATLQGGATVTRAKAAAAALKISDAVYKNDVLQTGANAALGVTFDDETTLSLSANAPIVIDEFVYEKGAKGNKAVFNIARGTVAFVASLVAKTGDMTITTPTSTLGIRGTTGVVDVPDSAAPGGAGEAKIRLYPDAGWACRSDRCVQSAGRTAWRPDARSERVRDPPWRGRALRCRAVPESHNVGRQMTLQRRQLRGPNLPRQNQRQNLQQQNPPGRPGRSSRIRIPSRRATRPRRGAAAVCRRG
ncbi:MAG: FecR domain-containing protein [Pseudolabrys sp.]